MIDHLSLGTHLYTEAVAFYARVLAPMGLTVQRNTGEEAAFGTPSQWDFFLYPAQPGQSVLGHRTHVAWRAPSRAAVIAAHAAALEARGTDLFAPRERPDISPDYFGAMFCDLDGHRVEVKTDAPA